MKVIITGTTGMIGEGILLECLKQSQIAGILSVSRKPTGIAHPKLKEYIVASEKYYSVENEKIIWDYCLKVTKPYLG